MAWLLAGCGTTPASEPVSPPELVAPAPALEPAAGAVLGTAPLCEPSAMVRLPDGGVLVGDNEVHDSLFGFDAAGSDLGGQRVIPVKTRVKDLEAMALHGEHLLLVGSHSHRRFRDGACPAPESRRRLAVLRVEDHGLQQVRQIGTGDWLDGSVEVSMARCRDLFVDPDAPLVASTCSAWVAAEAAASSPSGCQGAVNIEGAVALEDGTVWLGLRSPLVGDRAVMVRLAQPLQSVDALRFDAVAHVPLGGLGIRSLSREGTRVYGIAGPVADSDQSFTLWSTPVAALLPDAWPGVEIGPEVPSSSEGLVVEDGRALVVIDGAEGTTDQVCREPARQGVVPLPR